MVYMDLEQETHFIQVDAKKIADKDNTIKNLIMELAESKEKVQGRNVVILGNDYSRTCLIGQRLRGQSPEFL